MAFPKVLPFKTRVYNAYIADLGTASLSYATVESRGKVVQIDVLPFTAMTGASAVLSASIVASSGSTAGTNLITGASSVTMTTQVAGVVTSITPSGGNFVNAGDALALETDGGPSSVTPATISWTVQEF